MTSRYPTPPRRPNHPRSASQPRHSHEPPGSAAPNRADQPRSPRELRDTWHAREQRESSDRRRPEQRDRSERDRPRRERYERDPYERDRYERGAYDRGRYDRDQYEQPGYQDTGEHRGFSGQRGSQTYPDQGPPPSRRGRHSNGAPDPADSQSFRTAGRHQDSQSFPAVQDTGSFPTPGPGQDSGAYRIPHRADPGDSQGFRAGTPSPGAYPDSPQRYDPRLPAGYDPSDSQEFRRPSRYLDESDPHGLPDPGYRGTHQTGGGYTRAFAEHEYRNTRDSQEFGGMPAARNRPEESFGAGDPYERSSWNEDDLALFGDRRSRRNAHGRIRRRRGKRVLGVFIVLALLAGLGVGAWAGWQTLRGIGDVPDYAGTGEAEVIVQVADGASTSEIAAELTRLDVVASGKAFVVAAQNNSQIRSVQPGFYRMRTRMSGASAVSLLLEPTSRVGQLEIRGGMQLDDVRLPDGKVIPGILSLISTASAAELNGATTQVPVDQLAQAMATSDPAALGVPDWAIPGVQAAEPRRRLEGLIVPGTYNVKPGAPAAELLKSLVSASALRLQATAITDGSKDTGFRPYELLIIASLVEKEGITPDFGKVSRVIYNRLANQQRLQLDSTINYPLDRQQVTTSTADRTQPGPYNSYLNTGLPPTPIGSPSDKAIAAAVEPEPGAWRYFVKCQTDGTSCFAETDEQHQTNVANARARGIF